MMSSYNKCQYVHPTYFDPKKISLNKTICGANCKKDRNRCHKHYHIHPSRIDVVNGKKYITSLGRLKCDVEGCEIECGKGLRKCCVHVGTKVNLPCTYIKTKGKSKGQICGNICPRGIDKCWKHATPVEYIF